MPLTNDPLDPLGWRTFAGQHRIHHAARSRDGEVLDPGPFTLTKDTTMTDRTSHIQLDSLRRQRERLDAHIAKLEAIRLQYGDDEFEVGSVLVFDKTFRTGNRRTYSYAALKTPVGWYLTGRIGNRPLPWAELVDEIILDAAELPVLYRVTEMVEHEPDV